MIGNFLIFGDSYSTHKEYIPAEYPHYYCTEGRDPNAPVTKMKPQETWWGRMLACSDATLVANNSWSGSTIGYTGYAGDCSSTSSFICRYLQLREAGFFATHDIDTIFVFGGTNDSWSNAPLGEAIYENWKREDLFCVLPAICWFMNRLKEDLPEKRIVFIANCDIKPEIVDCMTASAERIGVECVVLHDVDKMSGHPTVLGMSQICEQIIEHFKA